PAASDTRPPACGIGRGAGRRSRSHGGGSDGRNRAGDRQAHAPPVRGSGGWQLRSGDYPVARSPAQGCGTDAYGGHQGGILADPGPHGGGRLARAATGGVPGRTGPAYGAAEGPLPDPPRGGYLRSVGASRSGQNQERWGELERPKITWKRLK